jgi:hypothetical protein
MRQPWDSPLKIEFNKQRINATPAERLQSHRQSTGLGRVSSHTTVELSMNCMNRLNIQHHVRLRFKNQEPGNEAPNRAALPVSTAPPRLKVGFDRLLAWLLRLIGELAQREFLEAD